jgi:hypothetical protein
VTLHPPRGFIPSGAVFCRRDASSPFSRGQIRTKIPARCIRRAPRLAHASPLDVPPSGGFSYHSVRDEHDAAGPIPRFNIFVARPGAPQLLAAFVDGPIDPSGGLNTGCASAEDSSTSFASDAPRACPSRSISGLRCFKISAPPPPARPRTISRSCHHTPKTHRRIPGTTWRRC